MCELRNIESYKDKWAELEDRLSEMTKEVTDRAYDKETAIELIEAQSYNKAIYCVREIMRNIEVCDEVVR